eukprot:151350-Rhodomonas_salina.1
MSGVSANAIAMPTALVCSPTLRDQRQAPAFLAHIVLKRSLLLFDFAVCLLARPCRSSHSVWCPSPVLHHEWHQQQQRTPGTHCLVSSCYLASLCYAVSGTALAYEVCTTSAYGVYGVRYRSSILDPQCPVLT